jgi:hypothetical protein
VSLGSPFLLLIQNSGVNEAEFAGLYNFQALMHALRLPSSMTFSHKIPSMRLTFCQQQQKVSKKCRPPNNALLPLIFSFLQVEIIRSRRAISQSPIHAIDLQK